MELRPCAECAPPLNAPQSVCRQSLRNKLSRPISRRYNAILDSRNHVRLLLQVHGQLWCLTSHREVLLGITGKDFTIIAASKAAMRGATILKASDDKTRELNKHTLMAYSGEAGDTGALCAAGARSALS